MDIKYDRQGEKLRIILKGAMTDIEAGGWIQSFKEYIDDSVMEIVLDFAELSYITSSGLRAVLMLQKKMNLRDGELMLVHVSPEVKEILDVVGFSNFLNILPDDV